jgi:hypothetical protein
LLRQHGPGYDRRGMGACRCLQCRKTAARKDQKLPTLKI